MSLLISVSSLPEFSVWLLLLPSSDCMTRTCVSVVPSHSLPSSLLPPLDKAPVIALGLAWRSSYPANYVSRSFPADQHSLCLLLSLLT